MITETGLLLYRVEEWSVFRRQWVPVRGGVTFTEAEAQEVCKVCRAVELALGGRYQGRYRVVEVRPKLP